MSYDQIICPINFWPGKNKIFPTGNITPSSAKTAHI